MPVTQTANARRATDAVPSIPCDAEGPVFREPWQAQAFAMALALHGRDVARVERRLGRADRWHRTMHC